MPIPTSVIDTGPLVAAADASDPAFELAASTIVALGPGMVIPMPVVVETEQMIRLRYGSNSARRFLNELSIGAHSIAFMTPGLLTEAAAFDERYDDLGLGLVDASVMAIADRRGLPIFTFDYRDFRATQSSRGPWKLIVDEHDFRRLTGLRPNLHR